MDLVTGSNKDVGIVTAATIAMRCGAVRPGLSWHDVARRGEAWWPACCGDDGKHADKTAATSAKRLVRRGMMWRGMTRNDRRHVAATIENTITTTFGGKRKTIHIYFVTALRAHSKNARP